MSDWFSLNKFTELKNKVEKAIPKVDDELIQKLTLRTPEMQAERAQMEEEEKRRSTASRGLSYMMPWETKDPEREILVEECKEAILALSTKEDSFLGPYLLPATDEDGNTATSGSNGGDGDLDGDTAVVEGGSTEDGISSADKLAKLEPLPPLLENFDLDAHVGLIERLLEIDTNLVEMQSRLVAGGDKEITFWRNYFFHCAYTRYEAGLSIDEIWAPKTEDEQLELEKKALQEASTSDIKPTAVAVAAVASNVFSVASGAAMNFMNKAAAAAKATSETKQAAAGTTTPPSETPSPLPTSTSTAPAPPAVPSVPATDPSTTAATSTPAPAITPTPSTTPPSEPPATSAAPTTTVTTNNTASSPASDFEMVPSASTPAPASTPAATPAPPSNGNDDVDLDDDDAIFGADPEMDELEAEIAKELED